MAQHIFLIVFFASNTWTKYQPGRGSKTKDYELQRYHHDLHASHPKPKKNQGAFKYLL